MASSAADLALALDVIAGPDERCAGIGYRLSLPPARHDNLRDFRVLVVDTHPLVPTGFAVRGAIARLSDRLASAGVKVACTSPLLPGLADSARLYMRLLGASKSGGMPADSYSEARRWAAALATHDIGPQADRLRRNIDHHFVRRIPAKLHARKPSERGEAMQTFWAALGIVVLGAGLTDVLMTALNYDGKRGFIALRL